MDKFLQDVRFAVRKLAKSPGFALLTIVTLALGIGANTAIFSVLNAVLLRPLPYPHPERLTYITSQFPSLGFDQFWVSPPEFVEFRAWNRSFESVGAFTARAANLDADRPVRPVTALVTDDLMTTLGVAPEMGRPFTRDDTLPGAEDVAILSHELWRRAFNTDRGIVGRTVRIDGVSTRVVGVMPPGYDVHDQKVELWLPLTLDPKNVGNRGNHYLYLVGRLKPGVGLQQARTEVATLVAGWRERARAQHTPDPKGHPLRVDNLQADVIGNVANALWVLQGAVVFVLLIACANLANLLLARADSRHREFAVRTALGAGRARLLRQFVTEGVVIAVIGGALGIALATVSLRWLLTAYPASIPRSAEVALDWRVLVFTLLIAIVTGAIFGLAPLLHLRETSLGESLKDSGTRTTAGTARTRTRSALVISEVALAVILVAGAGLLVRSFWNLLKVDAGFDRSRLMTFELVLPNASYPEARRKVDAFTRLLARIGAIPGVVSVTAMSGLPPMRQVDANDTEFEGVPVDPNGPVHNVDYYQISMASYFDTMKIPIVSGRGFAASDATGPAVAIVNEALAKRFYPGRDPVGRRIRPGFGPNVPWLTIVGVAKDVKQGGVDTKAGTELYFLQEQAARLLNYAATDMNIVVRSSLPFDTLAPQLRSAVTAIDASLPIVRMRTMDEVFQDSVERPRFLAMLLGVFAALALVLAAVGTYGILSYIVSERRHEIGVRMALGADRATVLGMVLRQGLLLAGMGLIVGLLGSFLLNKALVSLLFDITPTDPPTLVVVAVIIGAVALAACIVPAESATRTDPLTVLRE